ncbi:hypothetical protein, partial [Pseudomonas aeruginosa]|uniref:hypothetical protein n=1 Tax=Pseudomonas aeruginosa TaxID=287 RepID=UPI00402B21B4
LPVRMSVEQVSGSAWAECPNGVESALNISDLLVYVFCSAIMVPALAHRSLLRVIGRAAMR